MVGLEAIAKRTADQLAEAICKEERRADTACLRFGQRTLFNDCRHGGIVIQTGHVTGEIYHSQKDTKSGRIFVFR